MMVVLLLTTKYMSLATVAATLCSPLLLLLFKAPVSVILIDAAIVILWRCGIRKLQALESRNRIKVYIKHALINLQNRDDASRR